MLGAYSEDGRCGNAICAALLAAEQAKADAQQVAAERKVEIEALEQDIMLLSGAKADAEARAERWRSWAQFAFLGGGKPSGSDNEIQTRMCEASDARWREHRDASEAAQLRAEKAEALARQLSFTIQHLDTQP